MQRSSPRKAFSLRDKRVWVAGHTGLVGSAVVRRLVSENCRILTVPHGELDLTRQADTHDWMRDARPQVIVIAAAHVGGILANSRYPADFLYDNMMIAANIMHSAHELGTEKLIWLGSSCIYPRLAAQPIREDSLLTGPLEPTNEAYAIAKIAGLKLADAYRRQYGDDFHTIMPTNLYGPNDNFDPETAHVLPSLIRRVHEAKVAGRTSVTLWGTGEPLREFLHVDDLADACVFIVKNSLAASAINVGAGREISIYDLAGTVAEIVGFDGTFRFDTSKPDGTPRKRVDTRCMDEMGWHASIELEDGIRRLYKFWLSVSNDALKV